MDPLNKLQDLLASALRAVPRASEGPPAKEDRPIGDTSASILRFLGEHGLTVPEALRESSPEWIAWMSDALEKVASKSPAAVTGQVVDAKHQPVTGAIVTVVGRDLPSLEERRQAEQRLLGQATTGDNGRFRITLIPTATEVAPEARTSATGQERRHVSLSVVGDGGRRMEIQSIEAIGRQFRSGDVLYNAPKLLEVTIRVDFPNGRELSEYEMLLGWVRNSIGDIPLEDITNQDLAFLSQEFDLTEERRVRVAWLRNCSVLARRSTVPAEAFYAWGRENVPLPFEQLASIAPVELPDLIERLSLVGAKRRSDAVRKAVRDNVVPAEWLDRLADVNERLGRSRPAARCGTGRLLDAETGEPLVGIAVELADSDGDGIAQPPWRVVTDARGLFPLLSATQTPGRESKLRITVRLGRAEDKFETDLRFEHGASAPVNVEVTARRQTRAVKDTIDHVQKTLDLGAPDELLTFLSASGITSLTEIRRAGGLGRLEKLPVPADHPSVRALDAHADLARISDDTRVNASLIERGFDSALAVADAPRTIFMSTVADRVGDFNAAAVYSIARAHRGFLDNVAAGLAAERATGIVAPEDYLRSTTDQLAQHCTCRNCETAVSPLAYLIDLLKYTLKRVTDSGAPIEGQTLIDTFHQPLASLPASCSSVDLLVRQVRLCVEVLRSFVGSRPLADAARESALAAAEREYVLAAYESLLSVSGTSSAELRSLQLAPPEDRQAFADRLQIPLGRVRDLLLDATASPPSLSESRLEDIFGLVDTTRDPFAPTSRPELAEWRLERLGTLWRTQDFTNDAYDEARAVVQLRQLPSGITSAPPALAARIHYDAAAGQLGFDGEMSTGERNALLALSADRPYQRAIRQLYVASQRPPVIDPDLVGPDDLRHPVDGHAASDLWKKRRLWVDERLDALSALTETVPVDGFSQQVPDVESMLATMYAPLSYDAITFTPWPTSTPVTAFEELLRDMGGERFEDARLRLETDLRLSIEAFGRLMYLRAKHAAWLADHRTQTVTRDEWSEVRSILVQAQKARLSRSWRNEERGRDVAFGPETFWISLTEPAVGEWPWTRVPGSPLIDPDAVALRQLPDSSVGERARELWTQREARLAAVRRELQAKRESLGFEDMLRWALGHPAAGNRLQHDIDRLKNELNSGDPDLAHGAAQKVSRDLHLGLEAFRRLLVVRAKDANSNPAAKPTAAEWDDVYGLLTTARKIKHEFPDWIAEEQHPTTGVSYWTALKARLPHWRSSTESRTVWHAALRARSQAPNMDPDTIDSADLRSPLAGNDAFDLLQKRAAVIALRLALLEAEPTTIPGLDARLRLTVELSSRQLLALAKQHDDGYSIGRRLDQLSLDFARFDYLVRIASLATNSQSILETEWEAVNDILIQVWKTRNAAAWLAEERAADLVLSQKWFRLPSEPGTAPSPVRPANRWRTSRVSRQGWVDRLQTRVDQETSVFQALSDAVSAVEELQLPMLRDGLIRASDVPTTATDAQERFEAQATWLSANLLIDARTGGCQMTTRVAQAIETFQALIHALRTGQRQDRFQTWSLDLAHFDEEWQWMGSYASWRSAMLVFLYPENLLQPGLRRTQTPAFRTLLDNLRLKPRVSPSDACSEAARYSQYFQDVSTLELQASCVCRTRTYKAGNCGGTETDERCYFYLFGVGRLTRGVYWSRYDFRDAGGYAQGFWRSVSSDVPGFDHIVEIIGAVPYQVSGGQRFIFVLAKRWDLTGFSLVCAKYDLDLDRWSKTMPALPTPMGAGDFDAIVNQSASESEPPHVLFYGSVNDGGNSMYRERKIDATGTGWEGGPFRPLYLPGTGVPPVGMVRLGGGDVFVVIVESPGQSVTAYLCRPNPDFTQPSRYVARAQAFGGIPNAIYVGAFSWTGVDAIFLLTSTISQTLLLADRLQAITISTDPNIPIASQELASPFPQEYAILFPVENWYRRRILPTWGITDDQTGKHKQLVYRSIVRTQHHKPMLIRQSGAIIRFDPDPIPVPLVATITGPFGISAPLSDAELTIRQALEANAFATVQSLPATLVTYVYEAYFAVPIALALALQRSGDFVAALDWFRTVYADGSTLSSRKIYPGLVAEESLSNVYKRAADWLLDPLDPHAIAATRRNTHTRFTMLAIVRCLLDYADVEFTRDTAESNPVARRLYFRALALLSSPELDQRLDDRCEAIIGVLDDVRDGPWRGAMAAMKHELRKIPDPGVLRDTVTAIRAVLAGADRPEVRFDRARAIVDAAGAPYRTAPTLTEVIRRNDRLTKAFNQAALSSLPVQRALESLGHRTAEDFSQAVSLVTGLSPAQLARKSTPLPWLRAAAAEGAELSATADLVVSTRPDGIVMDPLVPDYQGTLARAAAARPMAALRISGKSYNAHAPSPILAFCIPPNPVMAMLKRRADGNLRKLRTCRNISGLTRPLDPYAAPTDLQADLPQLNAFGLLVLSGGRAYAPTLYRYTTLIERAKQLIQLAAQIEAAMLAALQGRDDAAYSLFKARQELDLAEAGVRLQDLRVTESLSKLALARLGEGRAQFQVAHFSTLIARGLSENEQLSLSLLKEADDFQDTADDLQVAAGISYFSSVAIGAVGGAAKGMAAGSMGGPGGATLGSFMSAVGDAAQSIIGQAATIASGLSAFSGALSTRAQVRSTRSSIHAMRASFERRHQEWEFQRDLASQDVVLAAQQTQVAGDEVRVTQQERQIAAIQQTHARDTIEYLTTKRLFGVEMYDWMSDVLQGVYRFFLQQATAMARLAEQQLAFERQDTAPAFVQGDYWSPVIPATQSRADSGVDRHGLTGSARLLQDIYQLDQFAFDTRRRKLQITRTISMAKLAPVEFQQFRESGSMTFATPMELFDRGFPGHYLRLISRVSLSVVALIPPSQGIHAVLTSSGLSRVVIGPDVFRRAPIRRDPEAIAFSSPMNATGIFELEPQAEMLRPFEGTGVDTVWEFRMPRAANQFDFATIADVLLTIDYTALDSSDYRQQVIQTLPAALQAEASFSFRRNFADQWFDLHNPTQTHTPMTVRFDTVREDFPPNVENLKIEHVALYFSRGEGVEAEIPVTHLTFIEAAGPGSVGAGARTVQGLISTRRGSGSGWTGMLGKRPIGTWELAMPNTEAMRARFTNGDIRDVLFVVSFSGRTPVWTG